MTSEQTGPTITRVEAIPLSIPFREDYRFGAGIRPSVEIVLVRIWSDDGKFGIGETQAWRRQGASETLTSLTHTISTVFAPLLIGRVPLDIADLMHSLDHALDKSLYAKAAVSDALYDLAGKILGVPVHVLLGGICRKSVDACAVLSIKSEIEATRDNAQSWHDRGYRTFTIKIGVDPEIDYRNVRAVRELFEDTVVLRVDANAQLGFDAALALLKKIEPFDLDAAEQPLPIWDIDGMAELARRVDIPIMADESLATSHDLIAIVRRRAASVIQTKQAKNGGISNVRKLWVLAEAAGLRIYPGNHPSTSIATAAVVQQAAAWPGELLAGPLAFGPADLLVKDVVETSLVPKNGKIDVPEGPGLGVALDEEAVAHYRVTTG